MPFCIESHRGKSTECVGEPVGEFDAAGRCQRLAKFIKGAVADVIKAEIIKLRRLKSLNFGVRRIEVATSPKTRMCAILSIGNLKPRLSAAKSCDPELAKIAMTSKTGHK